MPAPFAAELVGYRVDRSGHVTSRPNTSDANDEQSIDLGIAVLNEMGVPAGTPSADDPGDLIENKTVEHLRSERPGLFIDRAMAAKRFAQYAHLGVTSSFVQTFEKGIKDRPELLDRIEPWVDSDPSLSRRERGVRRRAFARLRRLLAQEESAFALFRDSLPRESLLKIDVTVATEIGTTEPELWVALSSKWTLRTDRAQDCVSQGAKLASQKRGRMPHFGVLTMENRPAMLAIPSDGPSVDVVYHLDLPALKRAIDRMAAGRLTWQPKVTFERLVRQGRLRDYDDLVQQVRDLPGPQPSALEVETGEAGDRSASAD